MEFFMIRFISNLFAWATIAFVCYLFPGKYVYAEPKVGIIIPELRAPYNEIYNSISDGVDIGLKSPSKRLLLEKDYDPKIIPDWVAEQGIDAVITLGSLGQKSTKYLPESMSIVLGAVLSSSSVTTKFPSVALKPDPLEQFKLLRKLDSSRTRIIVVYNPTKSQWLIDLAKQQVGANNMQLVAYKATNIKQAAMIYDDVLSSGQLGSTALWILLDRSVVDSKVVLPFILEKSWQKNIVVFSGSPGHVKHGILFCLYPNNEDHGKQAAELLLKEARGYPVENRIYPTEGLQKAINSRTAEHLGLNVTKAELREFDLVFPLSN